MSKPPDRRYNSYWFPAAAFAAGIAAATVAPPPRPAVRLAAAHVRWCYDRYVSYRGLGQQLPALGRPSPAMLVAL
ncbi:hypothetical protein [Mesorhizobium sp.]|uniref:hypothetical protein n=1 Tax=Mesorhizobium sp. TaxID=1871066 RepID=UPI00345C43CA